MTISSLPVGSRDHANHTQLQEKGLGNKMNAISGRKCLESFGRLNRNGSWARTFSALLVGTGNWYSRRCKLTWKVKGTRYNRLYFQLAVSTLPTEDTGSGSLLKTPTAFDGQVTSGKRNPVSWNSGSLAQEIMSGYQPTMGKLGLLPTVLSQGLKTCENGKTKFLNLSLLPTPRANKVNGCDLTSPALANRNKGNLEKVVAKIVQSQLLPTPTADDNPAKNTGKRSQDGLQKRAFQTTGKTSQLNPLFVTEMMGYPPDWLVLPFLTGETNQ